MDQNSLNDFNNRMTLGNVMGPPRNVAESAAQSFLDARNSNVQYGGASAQGGAEPYNIKRGCIILAICVVATGLGFLAAANMGGVFRLAGSFVVMVGLLLGAITGFGVFINSLDSIRKQISLKRLILMLLAGFVGSFLTPIIQAIGIPLPSLLGFIMPMAAVYFMTKKKSFS